MKIDIVEPFSEYADVTSTSPGGLGTVWTIPNAGVAELVTGLGGDGKAVRIPMSGGISTLYIQRSFTPDSKLTFHMAFRPDVIGNNSANSNFWQILDVAGGMQFGFRMATTGRLLLYGENDTLMATSDYIFVPTQVYRLCLTADMSVANSTVFTLSVDGTEDAGLSGTYDLQDQATQIMAAVRYNYVFTGGSINVGMTYTIGDIVVGTGECVDWGPLECWLGAPTADAVQQWDRLSGADNFAMVDDATFDGDTTYNSTSVVDEQDIFSSYGLPARTPEFILCMSLLTIARKEESADRKIANVIRVGGTDYAGADQSLQETYYQIWEHWQENPATTDPWLPAAVPDIDGGYRHRL